MEYLAFGEMAVRVDGGRQALTRRRERDVLAVLLASHGAPVPAERLLTEVWGDEAPGQTLGALQVVISRLRSQLEPRRAPRTRSRLGSTAAGYVLVAETGDVDTWSFEHSATEALAAAEPVDQLRRCDTACAAWRGAPYAGSEAPLVRAEATRLEELLLAVQERKARALLDLDRTDDATRLLAELAPREPFREGLWALLALAQYRCARQADALETLRELRRNLSEELGVDPTAEVQRLEQALLRQDPELLAPPVDTGRRAGHAAGGAHAPAVAGPVTRAVSVGRTSVIAAATQLLERSWSTGSPGFLLVAGEPGIGKSRLVEDLSAGAADDGVEVLVGRCHEGEYTPALWPWLGVVRELTGGTEQVDPLLQPLLQGETDSADRGGGTGLRMFDAVAELIRRSALERPLLLVIEDIHWADDSSLAMLRHLAGSITDAPLAVVCTRRTTEAETGPALVDTLAALARVGAERVRLDGLDADAVGELLADGVGVSDPRFAAGVATMTGGNPFFVLQYARLLAARPDRGGFDPEDLPVPDGVRDVLRQRVHRLPPTAVRALTAAAVMGHQIEPELLAELTGIALEDCLDALDLALSSGLLHESGAGYAFVHALERETLYAELSAARRMRLHDLAGRVLEAARGGDPDACAAIAHHAHRAAPLGREHSERACTWLARAAEIASARHAHPEALRLWELAVLDSPAESVRTAEAMCGVAASLLRMARTAEARETIGRAVRLAHRLREWDLVARAATTLNHAGVWSWREHGTKDDDFIALLTEALEHVADLDRARLLSTLQMEHYYGRDSTVADRVGNESLELARQLGDRTLLLEVLLVRIISAWGPGRGRLRLELANEVMDHRPEGELLVLILFQLASALYEVLDPDGSDVVLARCIEEASVLRHTGVEIPLAWWRYARARDLDDPAAPVLGREVVELHRAAGYINFEDLWCIETIRSAPPGAAVPESVIAGSRDSNAGVRGIVAHAVLEAGDPERAHRLLGEAAAPLANDYSTLVAHSLRVAVLAESGHLEELSLALPRLEPYAGQVVSYGSVDHLGVVDHFLACGYAALGDSRALEHAERAVVLNEQAQCAPWLRRAQTLRDRLAARAAPVRQPG